MARNTKNLATNRAFDVVLLWIAVIEPLSTLPQIITLYKTQDAGSLSLLSWVLFMAASITWLIYGIRIKSTPLIASSVVWVATELMLIAGIIAFS